MLTNHRGEGSPARRAPLRGERSWRRAAPSERFLIYVVRIRRGGGISQIVSKNNTRKKY